MSDLYIQTYNPDVLSCIANLSSDEVFTPPELANEMLDMLPEEIWQDSSATFLDPACKSGVFLREIAKRLIDGLENEFPDLDERLDHIFKKQIFGVAITELTSLLSRRSVYCSKYPQSKYSVVEFDNPEGNIRYRHIDHDWYAGRCRYCGASQKEYERDATLETHAYELIHLDNPEELYPMKFDVIVGNPPYQLSTGRSDSSQAKPVYNKFIEQAIKLNPRYLTMIVPSRWMNGGFGLDRFRTMMLNDERISVIHDYQDSTECFPGVDISGGICFFLWDRHHVGDCKVISHEGNQKVSAAQRPLLEAKCETFIRFNEAIPILHKVRQLGERSFSELVSPRDPFGLNYFEDGRERMFKKIGHEPIKNGIGIYYYGWQKDGIGCIDRNLVTTNKSLVSKWKVYISKAYGERGSYPYLILGKPFIGEPETCSNMTYLAIGGFETREEAENVAAYMRTRFFRFLVCLLKSTQDAYKKVYSFVPIQDFKTRWTDDDLYKKYGIDEAEIEFIESKIRPDELVDENEY